MNSVWRLLIFSLLFSNMQGAIHGDDEELLLVHAIFRHGNRTAEPSILFPNDPYINETYYPYGLGQLTNDGKFLAYSLGKYLRQRYDSFLGDLYTPEILEARTSDFDRTKMSLELVLAGLFPPNEALNWNPEIKWQPIPYNFLPVPQDTLFYGTRCPNFRLKYDELEQSAEVQEKYAQLKEVFDYLSHWSGLTVNGFDKASYIYLTLKSEIEWGLPLLEWAQEIYPQPVQTFTIEEYKLRIGTTALKKIVVGQFFKKIVGDTLAKINGNLNPQARKLFLYSGHEHNLVSILHTLDIYDDEYPIYGSCIMFEVLKKNKQYGVKIFYQNYKSEDPVLLKLPNCDEFCPLDQFVSTAEKYFPDEDGCGN